MCSLFSSRRWLKHLEWRDKGFHRAWFGDIPFYRAWFEKYIDIPFCSSFMWIWPVGSSLDMFGHVWPVGQSSFLCLRTFRSRFLRFCVLVWMGHYGHDLHKPSHLQVNLRRRGSGRAASPHTHTLCIIMIHYFWIHYDSLCSFAEILAHEPHSIERMCAEGSCELFYLYRMVALDHPIKFQR